MPNKYREIIGRQNVLGQYYARVRASVHVPAWYQVGDARATNGARA